VDTISGCDKPTDDLLVGWKDIASYLKCSVRKAQRLERQELPINRIRGTKSVWASKSGIDRWLILQSEAGKRTVRRPSDTRIIPSGKNGTVCRLVALVLLLAILYFYMTFSAVHQLGRLAVLLAAAGIAADLSGQAIEIGVLPGLAARVDFFTAFHRTAVMMSGYVANGMYSLSAFVLAWSTRRSYPVWVSSAGIVTGCFGLGLSTAALIDSASGMLWTNVFLVPCLLLWLAGVAHVRWSSGSL